MCVCVRGEEVHEIGGVTISGCPHNRKELDFSPHEDSHEGILSGGAAGADVCKVIPVAVKSILTGWIRIGFL